MKIIFLNCRLSIGVPKIIKVIKENQRWRNVTFHLILPFHIAAIKSRYVMIFC